ncbi:MFS transporter [Leptolyngbya sp. PCC 6406]|uniref:MFS transporter n=1 Tax=Leptolyngbya sp. PCC 6406 TaxID=1173264 RepID=UPI00138B1A9C|nr:MFS transporter [Leptolyngbya sp. PCC 6406]
MGVAVMMVMTVAFDFGNSSGWAAALTPNQLLGQLPMSEPVVLFSSPNFLLAVVVGVVMAFAFQLLFTNLAIAVIAGPDRPSKDGDSESLGDTVRGIETKVGLGLLISVSIALFIASFLAVKLSLVGTPGLGAITGISIWAVFFTALTWFSSSALGSLLGSIIGTATAGVQSLLGAGGSLLGANLAKSQIVSTAEEVTAAVRRELTAGFDPDTIRTTLQSSLDKVQLPNLHLDQLGGQFEKLLQDADLGSVADSDLLKNVNRDTFVKLVSSRTDLSKRDINRITDQLEAAWQKVVGSKDQVDTEALLKQLKSADPEDLQSGELSDRLNQLIKTTSAQRQPRGSLTSQAVQFGATALLSRVLQDVDLSDVDVEKIGGQLWTLGSNMLQSNGSSNGHTNGHLKGSLKGKSASTSKPFSIIQADLENYLLFSPLWKFNQEAVQQEFRDVIYDAEANPSIIRQELDLIDRNYFVQVLSMRDDLSSEKNQDLANHLEAIRVDVFSIVHKAEIEEKSQGLRRRVENYLRSTNKAELNPDAIGRDFQTLLSDPQAGFEDLSHRFQQFDRDTLEQLLSQRQDMTAEEASQLVEQLVGIRDRVLSQAQEWQDQAQHAAQTLRQKVADYLRDTHREELNPEGIQRDFKTLFDDPEAGASALRARLSQFDRETLVQFLSQRQDLSEEQVNQVLDQVESVRDSILQAPQRLAHAAKDQYDETTQALADYLRNTNLEELNPEGIQHDLSTLFNHPKAGATAWQARLSHVDRDTLVQLLSQRDDLTEEQVNRVIDQVQTAIRNVIKAPRRLANRVQQQAVDFEANLESYLRHTEKEELNPEGIKRDLQLLLQDPRAGLSSLGDRASHFDRATFVALLAQRDDMTEEEANHIADQLESSFRTVVEQLQKVQRAVQATIDKGFDNVRNYLNGLERPELNYEGIKRDFSQLFDDPQMGLDALRDRLTQFDRETLVAVMSSRDDISEADANGIIDQVEAARDRVLHQVERVQQETQRRLQAVGDEAQRQVRETRKMAAGAAWWVFSSALFSLAASASAGFLAVTRFVVP